MTRNDRTSNDHFDDLRDLAAQWRRFARDWTEMAKHYKPELGAKFRRTASAALHAAHEVDELLKARDEILAGAKPPTSH